MTELEDRWAKESSEEVEEDVAEPETNIVNHINHPLVKDPEVFMPIVLLTYGPRMAIGGMVEASDTTCMLAYPMTYMEGLVGNGPNDPNPQPRMMIRGIMLMLGAVEDISINYDSMYMLRRNSAKDMNIAADYENELMKLLASDRGIVSPSNEEVRKITLAR
jgi:hypothetical protein